MPTETLENDTQRGRPRDISTQQSILQATRETLLEQGYAGLTMGGVAARAGAGKATIYRWWPTKGQLVLEATAENLAIGLVPDTGNTRKDLLAAAKQLIKTFTNELASIVINAVVANLDDDPDFTMAFMVNWVLPWRESAEEALRRGIARGDLPAKTDTSFLLDVVVGTVYQRAIVLREPAVKGLAKAIVDLVMATK